MSEETHGLGGGGFENPSQLSGKKLDECSLVAREGVCVSWGNHPVRQFVVEVEDDGLSETKQGDLVGKGPPAVWGSGPLLREVVAAGTHIAGTGLQYLLRSSVTCDGGGCAAVPVRSGEVKPVPPTGLG